MELISDLLLFSAALGAGIYCKVLSRRLTRFTDLENGVGGAVAILAVQVDDLNKALAQAQKASIDASNRLENTTARAEEVSRSLELLMASVNKDEQDTQSRARSLKRRRRPASASAQVEPA